MAEKKGFDGMGLDSFIFDFDLTLFRSFIYSQYSLISSTCL